MIAEFMKRYLTRRGYLVLPYRVPMLLVSGNATAISDDQLNWTVNFPVKPYMIAFGGAYMGGKP